tara:strand:- start:398 stop:778 length:381 start_codon:yes stop_codon:yes gene_type:complete
MNKVVLIFIALLTFSCSFFDNKNTYIEDYSEFINEVSISGENFSDKQWSDSDSLYLLYSTDCYEKYKDELTKNERNKLNQLAGEYIALRAVSVGKGILSDIEDFGVQMESMIEAVLNELEIDSIKN